MNSFTKLWEEYRRTEFGSQPPPPEQIAAVRSAFFSGAWCQMACAKKLQTLEHSRAEHALRELEHELAREVSNRPAAQPQRKLAA